MKVRYLPLAQRGLRKHRNVADRIKTKIEELAPDPSAFAQVVQLAGRTEKRLRIGAYRVLFIEDGDELVVIDIGPRGSIYE